MPCLGCERSFATALLALVLGVAAPAQAQNESGDGDRHAGYYYPETVTTETYPARAEVLVDSSRRQRVGFVVELTQQMIKNPYPPQFVIFPKGAGAEKMIIVALEEGFIDTLYRGRALLAMLTSIARSTRLFQDIGEADELTFFDLLHVLGFEQITISDGRTWAHQITIE